MRKRTAVLTYELCVVLNKIDQIVADQAKKKKKNQKERQVTKDECAYEVLLSHRCLIYSFDLQ